MSGIVGILQTDGAPADRQWLQAATGYMTFRGPDAQQWWTDGPVGLGCALLRTTFEAQHEQQPRSLDGQVWIVADERIDGRADLWAQLRSRGRTVADDAPDVDLILHAYDVWGEGCVEHLIGDFAFALWDGRTRRFFCARDHFGAAPFYHARVGNTLLVSNTLNSIRLHPDVPDTLDEDAIGEFLLFNMRPASDATTFAAIRRLRPAHTLTASGGDIQTYRYWQAPQAVEFARYKHPGEYVERFRTLFEQAVGDRLRVDRIGTALSGGLDSTSIAVTAHRLLVARGQPFELRGATIAYRRLIPDQEEHFARQVADACGIPTDIYVAEDYITREPDARPAYVSPEPWVLPGLTEEEDINRHVAAYARVYLMGFGGDPLLSPSRVSWLTALRMGYYRAFARSVRRRVRALRRRWFGNHLIRPFPTWLAPGFVARNRLRERWETSRAASVNHDDVRGMARDVLWENIFNVADPGFAGVPVKARWPFFDLRLFNFIFTVPPEPWCHGKHLLREAMSDALPASVLRRPKTPLQGFPHLVLHRERGYPEWMRELAAVPQLAAYVDTPALMHHLDASGDATPMALGQVNTICNLAFWLSHQKRPQATAQETSAVKETAGPLVGD